VADNVQEMRERFYSLAPEAMMIANVLLEAHQNFGLICRKTFRSHFPKTRNPLRWKLDSQTAAMGAQYWEHLSDRTDLIQQPAVQW
jgi:hypothetical protein